MSFSRPLLLLIAVSTVGCLPFPHKVQEFPAVEGRVTESGVAVTGAKIFATGHPEGPNCAGTEHLATTAENGAFALEPDQDLRLFITIGDPLSIWTVCIEHAGKLYGGWANFSIGHAPESVRMACDLAAPVEERTGGKGLCRVDQPSIQTSGAGG